MSFAPPRPRCPFYGFHWPENSRALADTGSDECGLDFDRNGPCALQVPDYDVCPVAEHLRPLMQSCRKNVTFYPVEIAPAGVSLDEWQRTVMTRSRTA